MYWTCVLGSFFVAITTPRQGDLWERGMTGVAIEWVRETDSPPSGQPRRIDIWFVNPAYEFVTQLAQGNPYSSHRWIFDEMHPVPNTLADGEYRACLINSENEEEFHYTPLFSVRGGEAYEAPTDTPTTSNRFAIASSSDRLSELLVLLIVYFY